MRRSLISKGAAAAVAVALLTLPRTAAAQTVSGTATAVKVTTLGLLGGATTVLGNTGNLSGIGDARGAGNPTGSVGSILGGEALNAATMAWPDQVVSQASINSLGLSVAGIPISADFVLAGVTSQLGSVTDTTFLVQNLLVAGVPVQVTGQPNQIIGIPGGRLVLNEQTVGSNGVTTLNAVHAVVFGVVDVVVASATAGIR